MYKEGMYGFKIAEHFNRSQSCVSKHIHKHMEEDDAK